MDIRQRGGSRRPTSVAADAVSSVGVGEETRAEGFVVEGTSPQSPRR